DALFDCRRPFLGVAHAEPDHAVAVADDDKRAEAEILATFDDFRDAVDGDHRVFEVELRLVDAFSRFHLELQASFAGGVGDRPNPAVIQEPTAIEYDPL